MENIEREVAYNLDYVPIQQDLIAVTVNLSKRSKEKLKQKNYWS